MPGDYTGRTKSGFMPLTRTKHRLNLAREEDHQCNEAPG
jgi:hypothetical protein